MNNKRIDGKNAVLLSDGNNITVIYKTAFGEISAKASKRFDFTFSDVEDIEFKKPGISMNGFILIVLKNDDMHKIVINKLDEYSLEITDSFVKDLEYKIEELERPNIIQDEEEEKVHHPIINDTPYAIFPHKEKEIEKELEEKPKEQESIEKPQKEKNRIVVTESAIKIVDNTVKIVKPKSKEEIEKDRIKEELRNRIEAKKRQEEAYRPIDVVPTVKRIPNAEEKKAEVNIPTPEIKKPVINKVETKEEKQEEIVTTYIDTQEYAIKPKKKVEEEEKDKTKEQEIVKNEEEKQKEKETVKKKEENKFANIFKKLNITIAKDKSKNEEFDKEPERKIVVGTVETTKEGKEKEKVPIEVGVRPLRKEELEELEKKKNDVIIDELKYKLYVIESELKSLTYQLLVLQKYSDTTYDRKEIEKIQKQIEDLIRILEAIKQEILNKMAGKDYVANKALDVTGDDIVNVDDFKTIYVKAIDRINEFEAELNNVKEKTIERTKEINITDKEYEKDLGELKEKQDLIKEYEAFIDKTMAYTYNIQYYVMNSVKETTRTYIENIHQIRQDTRMLAALSAASMITPGLNGPVSAALVTATGISAMRDAIIPTETRTHTVTEKTKIDYSRQIHYNIRDAYYAQDLLKKASKDIKDIKKEVEKKYSNYPEYQDIVTEFDKLEVELGRQEKELDQVLYLAKGNYALNNNQKILVLENENNH